jgi:hypothetical protein
MHLVDDRGLHSAKRQFNPRLLTQALPREIRRLQVGMLKRQRSLTTKPTTERTKTT